MLRKFVFLILLFVVNPAFSQDTTAVATTGEKVSFKAHMSAQATKQITELHDGVLIVRLFTRQKSIDALRKAGRTKEADKMQAKQYQVNTQIVNAFRTSFDFCPVYFFYSDSSKAVRERRFQDVPFLNDQLQVDTTISVTATKFLTAEFNTVQQDTATYNYYVPGEIGPKRESPHYGGPSNGFGALIIKSDQFIQLSRPFPYYVRNFDSLPFVRRTPLMVVRKMNAQLHEFYGG